MRKLNDRNKWFVFKTICLNNRLAMYAHYLQMAKDEGYQILRMCDFYQLKDKRRERHFVLRHDVDHVGQSTRKMFEIEKEAGVTSTYYFRSSTIDIPLIQEMIEAGFEVGFHFETIANWVKETGCFDKTQVDIEMMRQRLKEEIEKFEEIIGCPIQSCCSHGASENVKLGISNNILTDGYDTQKLGVLFEAYDAKMYDDIDCHIMDGSILGNFGFSYKDNPQSAIANSMQNIVFLAHPNHWWMNVKERVRFLILFMMGKAHYTTERTFRRIAR